jgi:hypothetical protein
MQLVRRHLALHSAAEPQTEAVDPRVKLPLQVVGKYQTTGF